MKKIEIFKNNLKEVGFTQEFIRKSVEYFIELDEEREVQELGSIEEILDYFSKIGSFTCNTLQSEINLKDLREDLYKLYQYDTNNLMNFLDYFYNIEEFELQVLYVLYYEFYPQEESDEEEL